MPSETGWRSKFIGRFTCRRRGSFRDRKSMFLFGMLFTRPIFCISLTTARPAPRKPSSTPSPWLISPLDTRPAEPLSTKGSAEVATALERIYFRGPLKWPKLLQADPGREFMGAVNQLLKKHNVKVRRRHVDIHRDQAIVERFNRTLANVCFDTSTPLKCVSLRASGLPLGWHFCPLLILLWIKKSLDLPERNPLWQSKRKLFSQNLRPLINNWDLLVRTKKGFLPAWGFAISTNPANLKAGAEEPPTQTGPWKFTRLKGSW